MIYYIRVNAQGLILEKGVCEEITDDFIEIDYATFSQIVEGAFYKEGSLILPAPRPSLDHDIDENGDWVLNAERRAISLRATRNALLASCDAIITRALEQNSPVSNAWLEYRQALRDVPAQEGFPQEVQWPLRPLESNEGLDKLKVDQWERLKFERSKIELGPFEYNGMIFDGDLNAQRRLAVYVSISKTALAEGVPFERDFILADNTVVTLTAEDFVAVELAKADQVAAAFAKGAMLRAMLEAAETVEEVEAITWDSI